VGGAKKMIDSTPRFMKVSTKIFAVFAIVALMATELCSAVIIEQYMVGDDQVTVTDDGAVSIRGTNERAITEGRKANEERFKRAWEYTEKEDWQRHELEIEARKIEVLGRLETLKSSITIARAGSSSQGGNASVVNTNTLTNQLTNSVTSTVDSRATASTK